MTFSIKGKKILITGGARGIGGETARYFAREGADVVTFDIKDALGKELADEATSAGPGRVIYRHVDISNRKEIIEGVEFAVAELGGLDVVFNIAGVSLYAPAEIISEEYWNTTMAVNVTGLAYICQEVFPHLKEKGGAIINFSSDAALMEVLNAAAFSASKGAVISYTRSIAREWARYGIRCNTVNPTVMTPIVEETLAKFTPEEKAQFEKEIFESIPLKGKLGDIDTDLAPVLQFLASDASRFMTGGIIQVNGGLLSGR